MFPKNLATPRVYKEQFVVKLLDSQRYSNAGNNIILPYSSFEKLARMIIEVPMIFKIINDDIGRQTNCGVWEFTAEEGYCYLPQQTLTNLNVSML
jgi:ubiquitin fusion degradation protein 1